jgi:crotonobetainyl-CoA:carnitine CoA-transferase CaiB-like acyl-CoA transferase
VLDFSTLLPGPLATLLLAEAGAEVIKIERPGRGDEMRSYVPKFGADSVNFALLNRGKRSIAIDLKDAGAVQKLRPLIESADVVVEQFRPGVMDRLGLGYGALAAVRPDLVYCAISGFGQDGPLAANPAYDQIIQGLSGVMSVTGSPHTAPLRVGYPVCDTMGGITAAFAVAAALFRRERTGAGEFIDVSMLEATLVAMGWAVSNWLIAGVRPTPMGNENMSAAPSGAFRTGRGLLNIAANQQAQFESLCRLLGRAELIADPRFAGREDRKLNRYELKTELEQALARKTAAEWAPELNDHGVPAGEVLSVPEVLEHPQVVERGLIKRFASAPGVERDVSVVRAGFRLAHGDPEPDAPPPALGADTDRILAELGYDAGAIAALRGDQAI